MLINYLVAFFIVFSSFGFPVKVIKTIKNAHWEDQTVWSNGQIPSGIDTIFVAHYITLNQNLRSNA